MPETLKEIQDRAAVAQVAVDLPGVPELDFTVDPLPSLAEGEGIQEPLSLGERFKLGLEVASPDYNVITGLLKKPYDPIINPNFRLSENLDLLHGVDEGDYEYMRGSKSRADAEHRRRELQVEHKQMQDLMKDGGMTGTAITLAAGTVVNPSFWAGVMLEGASALNVISKASRIQRMAAVSGSTAAIETAMLAANRATVDAEDVLYMGAAGMLLGAGVGKLTSADDFLAAAETIQDDVAKAVMRDMDEDLVNPVSRKVSEPESIYGDFNPDEAAAIKTEQQAGDIPISQEGDIPIVDPDDPKGYADALYKNINKLKFNVDTIKNTKTFKILSKNPLMSDWVRLFNSEAKGIQFLASNLLEDASGISGRQKTAAIMFMQNSRKYLAKTMPELRKSYAQYAKDNGIKIISLKYWGEGKREHYRILRNELERYRNASARGVEYESTAPKHIQDAVNAWRKATKDIAELARVSGVRGFDEFTIHDGYVPLLWNGLKIARLGETKLKQFSKLLSRGYQSAGIDAKSAGIISKAVIARKTSQALGVDTNPGALLAKDSREFLREMLTNNGVGKAEQDALFGRIDVTLAERGKSARAKSRVPIDLTLSDGEMSLIDFVNNDLASVGSRYFTEISGRSALARKGITNDGAWRATKRAVLKEAQALGEDTAKLGEVLDAVYSQFLGQPVGEGIKRGPRRLMEWAMTSMLGTVGMAQIAESTNIVAAHGLANIMRYSPDLKAYRAAIKSGNGLDDTLLGELRAHIGGMWDEHLFFRPEVRLDQTDGVGASDPMWAVLDNVLAGGKEFLGYASGMNQIKTLQQQFTAIGQANKVVNFIKAGTEDVKILKRFADVGWDESTLKNIKKYIDNGTITFQDNGALAKLNLEKWDAKTLEDFSVGMHRHAMQIIQFPNVGETAYWQHKTIGAMLTQFRSFSILATEKQLARQIRMADQESVTAFTYALPVSALLYMTKIQALSIGRPDRDEYLEKRLNPVAIINGAMQWSGVLGPTAEVVNAGAAIGLFPSEWSSGGVGRSGTSSFSFDSQVPSLSVARRGMQFGTGMLTGLSPFNEHRVGKSEIDNAFAATVLGNTAPAVLLKNTLHNLTED